MKLWNAIKNCLSSIGARFLVWKDDHDPKIKILRNDIKFCFYEFKKEKEKEREWRYYTDEIKREVFVSFTQSLKEQSELNVLRKDLGVKKDVFDSLVDFESHQFALLYWE